MAPSSAWLEQRKTRVLDIDLRAYFDTSGRRTWNSFKDCEASGCCRKMLQPMPALNSTKRIDFVIMMFQQLGERGKAPSSGWQGLTAVLRNVIDIIHNPLFLCSPVLKNAQAEVESIFYRASRVPHLRREF